MKNQTFKRFFSLLALAILPLSMISFDDADVINLFTPANMREKIGSGSDQVNDIHGVETEPTQYVGYGYNATGGKALYEPDALMLNNPILDIESPEIKNNIRVFDGSKTEYRNSSSTKVTEIAESYGQVLGGGGGIGGKISAVNIDVNAKFNNSATSEWAKVSNEEYSYYTIFSGNRPVVLQMEHSDISKHLSDSFKKDLYNIKPNRELEARNLFNKYGTHLLTGYTLGGIFEMTNYYATNSDSYQKEGETSFGAQVNMALGSFANGNLDFSFTNNYGYKDNNKYATNQYKCTTYGGLAFPGLTIDQAFSWYETITGAGYVYQLWTDSINAGRNLVIVGIPQSSKLVPLWDLLPYTEEFAEIRSTLIDTYQKMAAKTYKDYNGKYQNKYITGIGNDLITEPNFDFLDKGFSYVNLIDSGDLSSYVSAENFEPSQKYKVASKSKIYMDYEALDYDGSSHKWSVEGLGAEYVDVLDPFHGAFLINNNELPEALGKTFSVVYKSNGYEVFRRYFTISDSDFSGGDGSSLNPYLISSVNEFEIFTKKPEYWDKCFKLLNNLDLKNSPLDLIGDTYNGGADKFSGTFDGNFQSLKNVNIKSTSHVQSLFYSNVGTIKNLNVSYGAGENATTTINNGASRIAGIACVNESNGQIINCTVDNLKVNWTDSEIHDKFAVENNNELYVGGIAAINNGKINLCHVKNFKFDAINIRDTSKKLGNIYIGGIVGKNDGTNGISYVNSCQVDNFSARAISASTDYYDICIGGAFGSTKNSAINDILVNELENLYADKDKLYAIVTNKGKSAKAKIGGFLGTNLGDTTTSNILIINKAGKILFANIDSYADAGVGQSGYYDITAGEFMGYDEATLAIQNCYIIHEPNSRERLYGKDKKWTNQSLKCLTSAFSEKDFLSLNDQIWGFKENDPFIKQSELNIESLRVDTSKTKTTFFKGENFVFNDLAINGILSDGTEFRDTNVSVDSSNYQPNILGDQTINVLYCGIKLTYNVRVVDMKTNRIFVKVDEVNEPTYYEGDDHIQIKGFTVTKVDEAGTQEQIPFKGDGVTTDEKGDVIPFSNNGFTYEIPKGRLGVGNNSILIKYDGKQCFYNLDAIKHNVKGIELLNADQYANKNYNIGIDDIDFSDLKAKVNYADDPTQPDKITGFKEVSAKELEFTYSRIGAGNNKIVVSYNVEYTAEMNVKGEFIVDMELVNSFKSIIEQIPSKTTLRERFEILNKANALYEQIGCEYRGDAQYNKALEIFKTEKKKYDDEIFAINNGYETAITLNTSINHSLVQNGGFITLVGILSWILKRM